MAVEPTTKYQKKETNEADFWCLIGQPIQHLETYSVSGDSIKLVRLRKLIVARLSFWKFNETPTERRVNLGGGRAGRESWLNDVFR